MDKSRNLMQTEVVVKSQDLGALSLLNWELLKPEASISIKYSVKVQYPHTNGYEEYVLPAVIDGDKQHAKKALEQLSCQRAITHQQYALLENALSLAQGYTCKARSAAQHLGKK